MGDKAEEYEAGAGCANCWGIGKTFGDNPTPKRIRIAASGFVGACAVCNGTFILTQNLLIPCIYDMDDGTRFAEIRFSFANTLFTMEISGGPNCYVRVEAKCSLSSTFGGVTIKVEIDRPATPAYKMGIIQNFSPSEETIHEDLGPVNNEEVIRLCRTPDQISIYFLYEPEY